MSSSSCVLCVMSPSLVSCQCYRITVKGRRQIHCDLATPHGHRQRRSIEQITSRTLSCIIGSLLRKITRGTGFVEQNYIQNQKIKETNVMLLISFKFKSLNQTYTPHTQVSFFSGRLNKHCVHPASSQVYQVGTVRGVIRN